MTKPAAQFIDPRDTGLRGLSLSRPVFDAQAVERAEQALDALSPSMQDWLDRDVDKLQAARQRLEGAPEDEARSEALLIVAHDLRGMGRTYGFPFISQLARSLCRLIEAEGCEASQRRMLIGAHVDAIKAAARARLRDASHPVGQVVLAELEAHVAKFTVPET